MGWVLRSKNPGDLTKGDAGLLPPSLTKLVGLLPRFRPPETPKPPPANPFLSAAGCDEAMVDRTLGALGVCSSWVGGEVALSVNLALRADERGVTLMAATGSLLGVWGALTRGVGGSERTEGALGVLVRPLPIVLAATRGVRGLRAVRPAARVGLSGRVVLRSVVDIGATVMRPWRRHWLHSPFDGAVRRCRPLTASCNVPRSSLSPSHVEPKRCRCDMDIDLISGVAGRCARGVCPLDSMLSIRAMTMIQSSRLASGDHSMSECY